MTVLLLILACQERWLHQRRLKQIPLRINVNGIRGKSTVTRLVTGILQEAGYKVVGKTTGTAARLMSWVSNEEKVLERNPEGPNINEQRRVVVEAVRLGANALVSECMAVHPDNQVAFQDHWLQANIVVITNVREDHLEEMGPTLDDVAKSLAMSIPTEGVVVVSGHYVPYFEMEAQKRRTKIVVADPYRVSLHYLDQFEYILFPENVALALAVARCLKIDQKTALRGMLNAKPDPGALRILPLCRGRRSHVYYVTAFSANDPTSTLTIWNHVGHLGYSQRRTLVIMHCRSDRVGRTRMLADAVLPQLQIETLVLIGEITQPVIDAHSLGKFATNELLNLEGMSALEAHKVITNKVPDYDLVFGMGNTHGSGESVISMLDSMAADYIAEKRDRIHKLEKRAYG